MNRAELLAALHKPPFELKFYECGSRYVEAKRIRDMQARHPTGISDSMQKETETYDNRYKSLITEETDFDFFCKDDHRHVMFLDKLGFTVGAHGGYNSNSPPDVDDEDPYRDLMCTAVWKNEQHNIQVVLRPDPLLYKAIFDAIPFHMYRNKLWKSGPTAPDRDDIREWFNTFYLIAKAVQELK